MAITNDAELAAAASEAGALLQQIQDFAGRSFTPYGQVRFPRGYLRTAEQAREQLGFLPKSAFKSNLSYALMLCDVQSWLLTRTDLSGTAKEMVIKLRVFLLGSIAESLTKVHLRGKCGGNYKRRTEYLVEHQIISTGLKTELDWLWDMRNLMHLFQVEEHEWLSENYTSANQERAGACLTSLMAALHVV